MMVAVKTQTTSDALLASILSQLDEIKPKKIVQIDLRGKTAIGGLYGRVHGEVFASGSAMRKSLAQEWSRMLMAVRPKGRRRENR